MKEESDGPPSEVKAAGKKVPPPRPAPPTVSFTPSLSTQAHLHPSHSQDNRDDVDNGGEGEGVRTLYLYTM